MTLRFRLLLSAFILSLATTLVLGMVVRSSWQEAEASRFEEEFEGAWKQLSDTLGSAASDLSQSLAPICAHDPIVDSALIGVSGGTMSSRLLSIRARVPELQKSLGLDELVLVAGDGSILAGQWLGPELSPRERAALVKNRTNAPGFRAEGERAFQAACVKKEGDDWVGLLGAQAVRPLLQRAGDTYDLRLSLHDSLGAAPLALDDEAIHAKERRLDVLSGTVLRADRSRKVLRANLRHLDSKVLTAAGATLIGALFLALFLSRGLARPVVQFAERTRQAVQGQVQELPISGGPELEQAARAFNATLADLTALRGRLKATEKIAARREVARQIAHEIKNPLSPIRTSIETLRKLKHRDHPEFDSYFEETTKTVLSEVMRISTLVSHFAEYARLPSPSPQETDLGALVKHIAHLHEDLGAKIMLTKNELPPIQADKDQIAQVVTNLLKNALEATADLDTAEVRLEVGMVPGTEGGWAMVSVSDNGPGLSSDRAEKIFEPYVTTKLGGTGLGLPISHRIAVEHGGDLTYTTPEGGGARFVLTLPTLGPPRLEEHPE